jgi:uncharacterized protein
VGLRRPLLVRRECIKLGLGLTILYVSDLHLRPANQDRILKEVSNAMGDLKPQLVLLGGDLTDHRGSLEVLTEIVEIGAQTARVGAVAGNHDRLIGISRIRRAVSDGGGHWLSDAPLEHNGVQILGAVEQLRQGQPSVLCSHYPTDFPRAFARGIDLVFAGHLHGWQIVLKQVGEYLYPGAWLSRWNGLRFERGNSTMLVSRGVTDLLPIRWNCPREVVFAEL